MKRSGCARLALTQHLFGMTSYTQSPHERKDYTAILPWGELRFGFRQGDPRCLSIAERCPW